MLCVIKIVNFCVKNTVDTTFYATIPSPEILNKKGVSAGMYMTVCLNIAKLCIYKELCKAQGVTHTLAQNHASYQVSCYQGICLSSKDEDHSNFNIQPKFLHR